VNHKDAGLALQLHPHTEGRDVGRRMHLGKVCGRHELTSGQIRAGSGVESSRPLQRPENEACSPPAIAPRRATESARAVARIRLERRQLINQVHQCKQVDAVCRGSR